MGQVVDFLEFKKKKEEDAAWDYLDLSTDNAEYLIQVLEELNSEYPGFFNVQEDTIHIVLEDNSLKQEEE